VSRLIAMVVAVLAGFVAVAPCHALFESKVQKAQQLIQIERYEDALRLLNEAVLDDPANPATHFEVGKAYLGMGREAAAEKTFSVLVRKLDPAYGVTVGKLYHDKGDWQRAVQFDPSRKAATAQDLFKKAKAALAGDDIAGGSRSLRAAVSLDPTLKTEASDYLVELGDNAVATSAQNGHSGKQPTSLGF